MKDFLREISSDALSFSKEALKFCVFMAIFIPMFVATLALLAFMCHLLFG